MIKRKRILIFGHYGVPNWGDEAILSGVLSQIDFARFAVTVVTDNPAFTKKCHGIKGIYPPPFGLRSLFRGGVFSFLKEVNRADYVLFGGGGLFQDRPEKALQIWRWYASICFWKQKKVFCIGNSFEALENAKNIPKLKKTLEKIRFFSVRDQQSKKILEKEFSVPNIKITSSSDGAYFLEPNPKPGRKKGILLAIREGEISEKREKKLIKILKEVFPKEFEKKEVRVLVMQEKNAGDSNFAARHDLPATHCYSLEEIQEYIRSSRFVLTTRLHAGILANLCSTPFLALAPRKKISQFFGNKFSLPISSIWTKKGEKALKEYLSSFPSKKAAQKNFMLKQKQKLAAFFPDFFTQD